MFSGVRAFAIIVPMSPEVPSKGRAKAAVGLTRRRFFAAGAGLFGAGFGVGAYARWVEPTWVEVVERDLPVPNLPPAWDGLRVVHIADIHHAPNVPLDYLARCMRRVADLRPDLVAVAGDFVTHADPRYGTAVAELFDGLSAPHGVFACLGNHDYGVTRPMPAGAVAVRQVADDLARHGVRVLRNEAVRLERGGEGLWIVGVDDLFAGYCDPEKAMRDVPSGTANLTLCHNPDAADACATAGCGAILAGHTHGGQVQIPLLGPPILPVRNKERYEGLHRVGGAWLYINRGLGWLWRVRFACRPEISLLTLRAASDDGSSTG
jgi:predicted MPP superfamily phosphohydrolase